MEKIKTFFKEHWLEIVLVVVIIVLIIFGARSCTNYKNEQKVSDANVAALMDSVETYKCKNGELAAEKLMLIGDMEIIEQTNEQLAQELKNMKVKNAKMAAQLDIAIKNVQHDTCWRIEVDSSVHTKAFNFNELPYRKLSGHVAYSVDFMRMKVDTDMVYARLDLAVEDNAIKVHTDNPYLEFTDIYGVNVPEYEPTWCLVVGPCLGLGAGGTWNPADRQSCVGLTGFAGISLTFGWNIVGVGKRVKKVR